MVSEIIGEGEVGKSHLVADIVARVSRGLPMPDGSPGIPASKVLLMSSEEDHREYATQPQVKAAGADMKFIYDIKSLNLDRSFFSFREAQDVENLTEFIAIEGIKFVVISPLTAFLPTSNSETVVRPRRAGKCDLTWGCTR